MGESLSKLVFQPPGNPHKSHRHELTTLRTRRGESISCAHLNYGYKYTLLFSHGNAEDIGLLYNWFQTYICNVLEVNALLYDYSGYGFSSGMPSEANCKADVEAAFLYLTDTLFVDPRTIILYGRSLGTAPTVHLAAKYNHVPFRGVILQSPLLSIYRIGFNFRFTLPGDSFPTIDYAPFVKCPVFVIHGRRDEVIPFWHAEKLIEIFGKYATEPLFISDGGHNNIETDYEPLLLAKLSDFIQTLSTADEYIQGPDEEHKLFNKHYQPA